MDLEYYSSAERGYEIKIMIFFIIAKYFSGGDGEIRIDRPDHSPQDWSIPMKKNQGILFQDLTNLPDFLQLQLPPEGCFVHWILRLDQLEGFLQAQDGRFRRHLDHHRGRILPLNLTGLPASGLFTGELEADVESTFRHPVWGYQQFFPEQRPPVILIEAQALLNLPAQKLSILGDWLTLEAGHRHFLGMIAGRPVQLPLKTAGSPEARNILTDEHQDWSSLPPGWQSGPLDLSHSRLPQLPLGLIPREKKGLEEASALRRKVRAPEILLPLDHTWFQPPAPLPPTLHHLGGIKERILVANMQGKADFREAGQVSHFQGGRFTGLSDQQEPQASTGKAQAFYTWEGKTYHFSTVSAFSLEGEESWGLRETLLLEGEPFVTPGRLTIDHFFVNDGPEFCISLTLRHPRFRQAGKVTGYGAFEWLVMDWAPWEKIQVQIQDHHGEPEYRDLSRDRKPQILRGAGFTFRKKNFALGLVFPQNQVPGPRQLPYRLGKLGGRTGLIINPEGVYGPVDSEDLDNWEEHFNFQVRLNPVAPLPLALTPQGLREFLPPFVRQL